MGLATDTTVYLSLREKALKVSKLTLTIRASDSSWHPGLSGRPLFPHRRKVDYEVRERVQEQVPEHDLYLRYTRMYTVSIYMVIYMDIIYI